MPHVIVKLWPGKTDAQKAQLAAEITRSIETIMGSGAASISVALEEVAPDDWTAQVYEPEIRGKWDTLLKRPGYGPKA